MRIARYQTTHGAQRYADELARRWPGKTFDVVPHPLDPFYSYAIAMQRGEGKIAYAAKRPKGFGRREAY